jgi:hypothetical protein
MRFMCDFAVSRDMPKVAGDFHVRRAARELMTLRSRVLSNSAVADVTL